MHPTQQYTDDMACRSIGFRSIRPITGRAVISIRAEYWNFFALTRNLSYPISYNIRSIHVKYLCVISFKLLKKLCSSFIYVLEVPDSFDSWSEDGEKNRGVAE